MLAVSEIQPWKEINNDFCDVACSLAGPQESAPHVQMDTPTFVPFL
jgi:hypothetical protein